MSYTTRPFPNRIEANWSKQLFTWWSASPSPTSCLLLIIRLQYQANPNNLLRVITSDDCSGYSLLIKRMLWNVSQTTSGFLEVQGLYIWRGSFLVEILEQQASDFFSWEGRRRPACTAFLCCSRCSGAWGLMASQQRLQKYKKMIWRWSR